MHPVLLEIGDLKFHSYPAMLAVAFITGSLLAVREASLDDPPFYPTPQGGLWAFIGALLGAKIFWILQYDEVKNLWYAIYIWQGGLVYYGGLIGGFAGISAYLYFTRLPYRRTLDIAAPYLALGQAITRIGCFLNGCCWGKPAEGIPWAIQFHRLGHGNRMPPAFEQQYKDGLIDISAEACLPVHPTQLYMVFGLALIALTLKWILSRPRPFPGFNAVAYCFLYGILRFVVEGLRGDSARSVFGMTVSQTISLGLVLGAVLTAIIVFEGRRGGSGEALLEAEAVAEAEGAPEEE